MSAHSLHAFGGTPTNNNRQSIASPLLHQTASRVHIDGTEPLGFLAVHMGSSDTPLPISNPYFLTPLTYLKSAFNYGVKTLSSFVRSRKCAFVVTHVRV
jgi:hypothetical protein